MSLLPIYRISTTDVEMAVLRTLRSNRGHNTIAQRLDWVMVLAERLHYASYAITMHRKLESLVMERKATDNRTNTSNFALDLIISLKPVNL